MAFWNSVYTMLELPAVYRLFSWMVIGDGYRTHIREYVQPKAGEKVLDIGCGPGNILDLMPPTRYVGFDINQRYIDEALSRFGGSARFFCGDVGLAALEGEAGTFDLVMATGVVHHLDDDRARRLFELAHRSLRVGGRLVTYDGCLVPEQSGFARRVVSRDRGRYVRARDEYLRLARTQFGNVEADVRHDLLRIPYTHLIMRCVK